MMIVNDVINNVGVQTVFGLFIVTLGFVCLVKYAKKHSDEHNHRH